MKDQTQPLKDDGERIIPTKPGEISFVYARHKFAYQYAQNFVENKTVLDVGCGTGYGSKILSEKATYVHGIDYDSDAINYCKQHYSGSNIEFYQADATKFAGERKFDVAVCFQAIEHFEDIAEFLKRLKALVNIGGTILISTPNVKENQKAIYQNVFHKNEMTYKQFKQVLEDHFSDIELAGIAFESENKLRHFIAKTPLYRLGRLLKRNSRIKKAAGEALKMTRFKVIHSEIEEKAADLLAICINH